MNAALPVLACGSMGLTDGQVTLILALLAGWLIALVLATANLVLLFVLKTSIRFKAINGGVFIFYVLSAGLMYYAAGHINDLPAYFNQVGETLALTIPLLVIGHFIFLVWKWRVIRRNARQQAPPQTI